MPPSWLGRGLVRQLRRRALDAVITDNAMNYHHSNAWRTTLDDIGAKALYIRPQTNGKAERFNRTLVDEWAYAAVYDSSADRAQALPTWLHTYKHHRSHTALGGATPIERVNNLSGHYS